MKVKYGMSQKTVLNTQCPVYTVERLLILYLYEKPQNFLKIPLNDVFILFNSKMNRFGLFSVTVTLDATLL